MHTVYQALQFLRVQIRIHRASEAEFGLPPGNMSSVIGDGDTADSATAAEISDHAGRSAMRMVEVCVTVSTAVFAGSIGVLCDCS